MTTFDCLACEETYWSKHLGPHTCDLCGAPLSERREGARPFEAGSYVGVVPVPVAPQLGTLPLFAQVRP